MQVTTKKRYKAIAILVAAAMLLSCFGLMQSNDVFAADSSSTKQPYKDGDNIKDAVFYIAVDANDDGALDDVYYYTEQEIKDYNETVEYKYNNHGQTQTDSVKGAKLSSLIENLGGEAKVEDTDTIIYMEHDAYHSTPSLSQYHDTVAGLEKDESGNGSGAGVPVETIIGYCVMTTFEKPDENNVDDTEYTNFKDFLRENSPVRAYRQTGNANSVVNKMLIGVVITGKDAQDKYGSGSETQGGYYIHHVNESGETITDDYEIVGLVAGMKWPAAEDPLEWATMTSDVQVIDVTNCEAGKANMEVTQTYKENDFVKVMKDDSKSALTRLQLREIGDEEFPSNKDASGTEYTYYGYNKPMYLRYQGAWLKDVVGSVGSKEKVYIATSDGTTVDITNRLDDFFVAYYYSESKSSTNISNGKRVPLNYAHAVIVDTASADVEYSNDGEDYEAISGKSPTTYEDPEGIVVTAGIAAPTSVKAKLKKYNKASVSWKAVKGASGYTVSYKKASASKWTVANTSKTTFTKGSLAKGKKYQFKVKAYKAFGKAKLYSSDSKTVKATTLKASTLKVKKSGRAAVKVKFSNIKGESGYQVYRSLKAKKAYKKVKTLKANKVTFKDTKVKKGKTYYYKVRAYQKAGGKKVYGPWSKAKKITR